ncbi:hypothetical protein CU097_012059 [Rhizopus azygosporus]|uniref:Uncharacterized protein n=1 Tax=Rhizopus azygosporus TaxID=86630 RepID=A0A367JM57_RHIAZ|nr:hypothetical protein CU097_012059 [Rhizopus azygosporus]
MGTLLHHWCPPQAQLHILWSGPSRLSIASNGSPVGMAIVSHFIPAATTSMGPSDSGLLPSDKNHQLPRAMISFFQ